MSTAGLALILVAVLLGAIAQLMLKAGTNVIGPLAFDLPSLVPTGLRLAAEPHVLGGVALYALSLFAWLLGLSRIDVSVAYPMVSLGYVVIVLAAWWWLGEAVTPLRLAGVGMIVLGVVMVARS